MYRNRNIRRGESERYEKKINIPTSLLKPGKGICSSFERQSPGGVSLSLKL